MIHEAELFSRFRAHYHFRVRFCNPYSGWEKGNVERKVDYNRVNLFVPVPHFSDVVQYNHKLLLKHERKASELHYKKQVPICELFEEDRKALLMLPPKPFNICRYEWLKADGYGKVCMDGKHFYSTRPENANQKAPDALRTYMDAQPKEKLKDCLRIMNELQISTVFRLLLLQWKWHVPEGILIFVMHRYWLPGSPDMGSVLRQRPAPHWRSMTKHS